MASARKPQRIRYLAIAAAAILLITIGLETLAGGTWLDYVVRGAALCAYMTLFLSIVTSNYLREMVRFFGYPFVKLHHIGTVTALALIVVHPLGSALNTGTLAVFIPMTQSWYSFFANGGRVAWYLFILASMAAVWRKALGKNWRIPHWLTYLAFAIATVHGLLLGSNTQFLGVRVVAILMALGVAAVFVLKRRGKAGQTVRAVKAKG